MGSRFVLERSNAAQCSMRRDRQQHGYEMPGPVSAGIEVVQSSERCIAVRQAPARDDEPPPTPALEREIHGAGVPGDGLETSTAKAMFVICACESRSMT